MKIWLYIMLTVIAILLVVGIALEIFFRHYVANETLRNATRDTTYAADAFSEEYENILKRFVSHTASADSYQLMCDVSVPHTKEYMNLNTSLQSQLSLYTDSSSLIHTAMFSDTKGQLFYSYKSRLRDDTFSPTDTYALSGAPPSAFIPATQSPFRGQSDMVVITYLLTVNPSERMVLLADSYENCDAVLYFFLNAQHIQDYLALYYNGSTSDVCSTLPTAPVLPSACPLRMTIMPSPRTQPSSAASAICPVPAINYCTPVTAISFSCRLQTATCIWQISCRNMRFIPGSAALTLCSYRSLWSCFY